MSVIAAHDTPSGTSTMCTASVKAIWARAQGTGSTARMSTDRSRYASRRAGSRTRVATGRRPPSVGRGWTLRGQQNGDPVDERIEGRGWVHTQGLHAEHRLGDARLRGLEVDEQRCRLCRRERDDYLQNPAESIDVGHVADEMRHLQQREERVAERCVEQDASAVVHGVGRHAGRGPGTRRRLRPGAPDGIGGTVTRGEEHGVRRSDLGGDDGTATGFGQVVCTVGVVTADETEVLRPNVGPRRIRGDTEHGTSNDAVRLLRLLVRLLVRHLERTTGFEPATPTLARLCSTN